MIGHVSVFEASRIVDMITQYLKNLAFLAAVRPSSETPDRSLSLRQHHAIELRGPGSLELWLA